MGSYINLQGSRFGRLSVVCDAGRNKYGGVMWQCKCDCGNDIIVSSHSLLTGNTTSCGCYSKELVKERNSHNSTHNMTNTRLYGIWRHMKERCYNRKHKHYADYGGRGISVCKEWQSFEPFKEWAYSAGYSDTLTLDRKDCNGDYSPTNCRWATSLEQANNKRNSVVLSHRGEVHTIAEWGRITGISRKTIAYRIRHSWPVEKALTKR